MPANLPPQYFEAEKKLRSAKDPAEKIEILEELLAIMPHHKGTDHLRADLRAKIAKLTQSLGKKALTRRASMVVPKEGAAQIAIVGPPNVGKSQLVCSITNASPVVADYPFTTQNVTPGMMEFENIKIQLLDTPPLAPNSGYFWLPHLLRRTDALLIMVDLGNVPLAQMTAVLAQLREMRIGLIGTEEAEGEGILSQKRVLVAGNKLDVAHAQENYAALKERYGAKLPTAAISAKERMGLEELKLKIYQMLDIIRVYTKAPGQKPEFTEPIVLERGSTVAEAAAEVHKIFAAKLKYARVWGSGKHEGLRVRRDHVLQDGDIIELHV